jgi:diguanylate cyclase (GGDEF)-like protein/PAS domain S-box-containing protein
MPEEDLVGRPFTVVYQSNRRDHMLQTGISRFADRAIEPHLARCVTLWNGRQMWIEASNSFVERDGHRPLLLSIFRDVTDRRQAEEEIRHARDYSENLIANAPVLVAHLDPAGRVKKLNRTAERVIGYRTSELVNRSWLRLIVPRHRLIEIASAFRRQRRETDRRDFVAPLVTRFGEERMIRWNYSEVLEDDRAVGIIAFGADITEARATARVLSRYELLLRHSSDIMLLTRPDGGILEANVAATTAYEYAREEMLALNIRDLQANKGAESRPADGVLTIAMHRRRCGTIFPVEISTETATVGDELVVLCVIRDITERRAAEAELERQAFHDPLTGLATRALFMDRLNHALAGTVRRRENAAVLFLDLDHFKRVNDTLGHDAGDTLLVAVAHRIVASLRGEDTAARFGGDEFTILLENLADGEEATRVADRLLRRIAEPFPISGQDVYVTASVGIAFSHGQCRAPEDLLKAADTAMYQVKESGRSNYTVFRAEMNVHAAERQELETELRRAIERNEFHLHYQPVIHMGTGRITGVEALVRWQHPRHGLMAPNEFIPLQERIGLAEPLTMWALETTWRCCDGWRHAGHELYASINLCSPQLLDQKFPSKVEAALRRIGAGTGWLKMEVTEAAIMADPGTALKVLRGLDSLGIQLSLDDFGTGYSSLSSLKDLPVHEFKIDRSLIAELRMGGDGTLVRAAIDLAHTLGREVVAEGVEDAPTWRSLCGMSCDLAQGYYMGAPMPADDLGRWLSDSPFGER